MNIHRDATTIVFYPDSAVFLDEDVYLRALTRHELVHTVVNDLIDKVVKAPLVCTAYIHARPAPDGFHGSQDLDVVGCIGFRSVDALF